MRTVLIPMPRACDTSVDDSPFSQRPLLMGARIAQRRERAFMPKNRDTDSIGEPHYLRASLGDVINVRDIDPFFAEFGSVPFLRPFPQPSG